ncbi:hypothetical protein HK097_005662 [Rhizophlyctis rosea]|uniref:Ras GEF n=1 Tax=Rhizophlyctis rosea TaxID=64517 RepID=A0AAD5SGK7_9FUNG|nr:hypothetical protein HK097_005662 [Rhizophlyctis rosea]
MMGNLNTVNVEGPDGTMMTVPALPLSRSEILRQAARKQSVAGPKIMSILNTFEVGDPGKRLGAQKEYHNQSLELLNDRAVARKHKTVFEEGEEDEGEGTGATPGTSRRRRLLRSPDGKGVLPASPQPSGIPSSPAQPPPKIEVTHGFGHFRRKHHGQGPLDGEADFGSTASLPNEGRSSVSGVGTPTTFRKGRKGGNSTLSLASVDRSRAVSAGSVESELDKPVPSPAAGSGTTLPRRPSRNFKEWYTGFVSTMSRQGESPVDEIEFPDAIELETIFGSKKRKPDGVGQMIWASKCYENCRNDPSWGQRAPSPIRRPDSAAGTPEEAGSSPTPSADTEDEYSFRYRVLDIFQDGKVEELEYDINVETGMEIVVAGTPDKLLDALIFPLGQDMTYADVFLSAYRFFLKPHEVFNWLVEWYNTDVDDDALPSQDHWLRKHRRYIQLRVTTVLLLWVKNYWNDFHRNPELFADLTAFVEFALPITFGASQKLMGCIREQRLTWYTTHYIPPFVTKRGNASDSHRSWALQWDAKEFAQQLSLIDHMLFKQIRPDCYLHLLQAPVPREGGATNGPLKTCLEYVAWFRLVGTYVEKTVLTEESAKKKGRAIKQFIKIAKACRELNNFNTAFAITWGLSRPTIVKLNQAWESLSSKHLETFKYFESLTDPANGYETLWTEIKAAQPPGIPFLAAYMQELLELHEDEEMLGGSVEPRRSTLARRGRKRRRASFDGTDHHGSVDENMDANGNDSKEEQDVPIDSTDDAFETRKINFEKFYNLHEIITELEAFRTVSYQDNIHVDKDSTAMVFTHLKDFTLVDGESPLEGVQVVVAGSAVSVVANKSDKSVKKISSFAKMRGSSSTDMPGAT